MAELTPLDEKLGEVLGLARAAQEATSKVAGMEGAETDMPQARRIASSWRLRASAGTGSSGHRPRTGKGTRRSRTSDAVHLGPESRVV